MRKIHRMVEAVKSHLTDDLRKPQYRGHENCLAGHCYVASEALYHMLGGAKAGWVPQTIQHEGGSHWYLKHKHSGAIIDPTKDQFATPVPYTNGRGCGFLTKQPSKRTQTVLNRVAEHAPMAKAEDLDKTVGYIAYPKLGMPGPYTAPMPLTAKQSATRYRVLGLDQPKNNAGETIANVMSSGFKPVKGSKAKFASMIKYPQPAFVQNSAHESQHSIFSRLAQKHGPEFRNKVIQHTMSVLKPHERDALRMVNLAAHHYDPEHLPEEHLAYSHNYLMDPQYREKVANHHNLSPETARNLHTVVKGAFQKMRTHAATLDQAKMGLAKTEAAPKRVACSIAVFNSDGHLLMGQRNDSKKWTLPGGKAEPGELPEKCARRELKEEAGLEVKKLKFLGKGSGGLKGDWTIYSYEAHCDDKPSAENDPDRECDDWEWVDVRFGMPDNLKDALHNGNNDVTLQLLGLQPGSANTEVELSKGLKHALIGAITAASMVSAPALADNDHPKKWTPAGMHEDLLPIAHLESSFGQNTKHKPSPKGDFDTAVGAVGLKPSTAHDEYKNSKWLQKTFPHLEDPTKFLDELKQNNALYNHVATSHWQRLKQMFGGDRQKAAYAWRWGQGAALRDTPEVQAADPYALAYQKLFDKAQQDKIGQHLTNPLNKAVVDEWLAKDQDKSVLGSQEFDHYSNQVGMHTLDPNFQGTGFAGAEARRPGRIPRVYVYHADTAAEPRIQASTRVKYRVSLPASAKLYNMGDDEHGLLTPTVRHTKHGTFYDAVDLDDIERKIKNLGYVGYHNYHPQIPNAVALFVKTPVKSASPA